MATPNYGYNLPSVFGDDDAWGDKLNENWAAIDADLKAVEDQADAGVAGNVPVGGIIMWSGTLATIPTGWTLCDGTNSTPDLRDRFIVGAADGADPGATGGANNVTLTTDNMPAHGHGGGSLAAASGGGHSHSSGSLAAASGGSHSHEEGMHAKIDQPTNNGQTTPRTIADGNAKRPGSYSGGDVGVYRTQDAGSHTHSISGSTSSVSNHTHSISGSTANAGNGQPFDNRPAFYALAFIMRTA